MAGYKLYLENEPNRFYMFDKSVGGGGGLPLVSSDRNKNRTQLNTFGARPYVYYAGHTNYQSFQLETSFLPTENDWGEPVVSAYDNFLKFESMVNTREPIVVQTPMGETLRCDVEIVQVNTPKLYQFKDMDFLEVRVSCVEIAERGR